MGESSATHEIATEAGHRHSWLVWADNARQSPALDPSASGGPCLCRGHRPHKRLRMQARPRASQRRLMHDMLGYCAPRSLLAAIRRLVSATHTLGCCNQHLAGHFRQPLPEDLRSAEQQSH